MTNAKVSIKYNNKKGKAQNAPPPQIQQGVFYHNKIRAKKRTRSKSHKQICTKDNAKLKLKSLLQNIGKF